MVVLLPHTILFARGPPSQLPLFLDSILVVHVNNVWTKVFNRKANRQDWLMWSQLQNYHNHIHQFPPTPHRDQFMYSIDWRVQHQCSSADFTHFFHAIPINTMNGLAWPQGPSAVLARYRFLLVPSFFFSLALYCFSGGGLQRKPNCPLPSLTPVYGLHGLKTTYPISFWHHLYMYPCGFPSFSCGKQLIPTMAAVEFLKGFRPSPNSLASPLVNMFKRTSRPPFTSRNAAIKAKFPSGFGSWT